MADTFRVTAVGPLMVNPNTRPLGIMGVPSIVCPVQLEDGQVMACFWRRHDQYPRITSSFVGSEIVVTWGDDQQDYVEALWQTT